MIKDFGNQKLPRFKAGQPLLDQVTAERLNDICSMIESSRLQNGVGYMMNRTSNGTTLSIFDSEYTRPPKLWKVSLTDVDLDSATIATKVVQMLMEEVLPLVSDPSQFTGIFYNFLSAIVGAITTGDAGSASGVKDMVEGVLAPIYSLIDTVDDKVERMLDKIDPIRATLESYFAARGKRPKSGDMIYTNELGICYVIFKETSDEDGVYPTPNLIFRVPFTVGASQENAGQKYYALTTFPMPDIAEIIKTAMKAVVDFVSALFGSSFEGIIQAIMDAVSEALYALYELLWEVIQEILEMISEIWAAIMALQDLLNQNIEDLLNDLATDEGRITSLENQLANAGSLAVLAADGFEHTIQVLSDTAGSDKRIETTWLDKDGVALQGKKLIWEFAGLTEQPRKEITWIDSNNGEGHKAETFLWNDVHPNVVNVDWRPVKFIGTDGVGYEYPFLLRFNEITTQNHSHTAAPMEITVCEDGLDTTKTVVEIQ